MVSKPQEDLSNVLPDNPDVLLFCDGSYEQNFQGHIITGYGTVSPPETLETHSLPTVNSAQVAELIALNRARMLVEGKAATYTDSK